MGGKDWSDIEEAIVMFLGTKGISHTTCSQLLSRRLKGSNRTTVAVCHKLAQIRKELKKQHKDVDAWIRGKNLSAEEKRYLELDEDDLAIIRERGQVDVAKELSGTAQEKSGFEELG